MSTDPSMCDTHDGWGEPPRAGHRVDRFTVQGVLGRGGWGIVYRATDPLSDETIALKVVPLRSQAIRERVAREIAALRLAADPGVVRLIGHGSSDEGVWIAMELVQGVSFPKGTWDVLAPTVVALVETIARVHRLGLVHRDLKPGNVLVRADGRPVVLDFGLASGDALGAPLTREGALMGTPRYQAPEQLFGGRVDDRADIYALAVMLYEALAGSPPHDVEDLHSLRTARASQTPPPLELVAPSVPAAVARLIRRMMARVPDDRPSAAEVAHALRGRPLPSDLWLPRLDGDVLLAQVLERLARGESVDIWGPRRSGRTRLLEDIAARAPGVVRAMPEARPFGSLVHLTGPLPDMNLADVERIVGERLARLPGPLLVDDWGSVDGWSSALLLASNLPKGQLRVRDAPGAIPLTSLSAQALGELIEGPERVLHLPSDAGALLLRRTGGWPGRVIDQLQRWVRQGRMVRTRSRFSVDRDTLDALIEEVDDTPPSERTARELSAEQEDVLIAVRLAWPHATLETLGAVLGRPKWEIEAQAATLTQAGCLLEGDSGLIPRVETVGRWSSERRRAAHAVVADGLPSGAEGRLNHLLAAGAPEPLAMEIRARVDHLLARGQVRRAIPLLWTLRSLAPDEPAVAERLVGLLLELRTADGLEQAGFAAGGDRPDLRLLIDVARLARQTDTAGVAALLDGAPPWRDPELAMLAHSARFEAARREPTSAQEALLRDLEDEEAVRSSPGRQARWQNWLGILRFRQRRFDDAARIHEDAAPNRSTEVERLTSLTNAIRAWIAADDLVPEIFSFYRVLFMLKSPKETARPAFQPAPA